MKTTCVYLLYVYLLAATVVQAAESSTRIAVSVLDEEHGGIYVLNADGSGKQRLTKGSSDILPRWSPDGKQIAFLALREQDHELAAEHDLAFHWFLYVMDADGQNQRRVTKTPIGMIFQWSPDGSRFVFQSSCEDENNKGKDGTVSSAIYVIKADGTQQKRLTPIENDDGFPSWSPDGKRIAFCSNRDGNMDIFVINADGSEVRRLTSNRANDIGPTWSPDGKQIAFTSPRESGNAFVMNADGTQESPLIVRGRPVAWSPDGQSLLLENDGQLVLSDADGRNQKELTKAGESALDGEFSADGNAVLYRSKVNGTWTLMSVDTQRSSQKRIWSDSGKLFGFSVSPSRVSLAADSIRLPTSNMHLTEFGNACRKSEKLYDDSRKQLFALIPDFLDWKRREIEILYSSTTNAFEVRVIFTPPDGTKGHLAVLVSANRHLVQNKKVDLSKAEPTIRWDSRTNPRAADHGRCDGHVLKQAAFVLEGKLVDKASLAAYLKSINIKGIGKFVSSRIEQQAASAGKPKSEGVSARRETPIEPYDGRCESPMPPEAIASLLDEVIEDHPDNVTLTLVRHPRPSTQPSDTRTAWVCMVDGKPLWVIAKELRRSESKSSGLTSRAIRRAREFVAEREEMKRELKGKERTRNWHPKKEAFHSTYQSKEYGLQITEIRLVDRETESWKVTVAPIHESMGGEIWMRFRKGHAVSAEFGR